MTNTPAVMRLCDCRCPAHHGHQRTTYNDERCACAITCATQPMTLLAEQWNCALFLGHGRDLWYVNQLPAGQWDWSNADHIHEHQAPPRSPPAPHRHNPAQPLRATPPTSCIGASN